MKKLISVLLVLVSIVSFGTVNAEEWIVQDRFSLIKMEDKTYNRFLRLGDDKILYYDTEGGSTLDIYNKSGLFIKGLPKNYDDVFVANGYFYVTDSPRIFKYTLDGELVKNVDLSEYSSYDMRMVYDGTKIWGILKKYDYSLSKYVYKMVSLTTDLDIIEVKDYKFSMSFYDVFYHNGFMYGRGSNILWAVDSNLNTKVMFSSDDNNIHIEAAISSGNYVYLTYTKDYYTDKHYLVKIDNDGKVIWEKEFVSSIKYIYYDFDSIKELDNGNLLLSMGSLYEVDKNGNIINSCKKCSFLGTADIIDGKYKGIGRNLNDLFYEKWPRVSEPQMITLGTAVKLEVKDSANGRVRVSRKTPRAGEEVIITLRPQINYGLDELKVVTNSKKNVEVTKISDKKYSFVMQEEDTSIEVTYKKK